MGKKSVCLTLALALLLSSVPKAPAQLFLGHAESFESQTSKELQIAGHVNGTAAYSYALEMEKIALNHSLSDFAFRSGGSSGANATSGWIKDRLEHFGLEARFESFMFTNWNLRSKSSLLLDEDGLADTASDQTMIDSFQCEHYSWPTSENGVFADLVVLPLPSVASFPEIGMKPINMTLWDAIDTEGKIVMIGREIRLNRTWEQAFRNKLSVQPPAAVVYSWSYPWMSFAPPSFSSVGGRPTSNFGPYCWDLKIASGEANYDEGRLIRDKEGSLNVSAKIIIPSMIGVGPHYNVVGRLQGAVDSNKLVILCGHYDSVMTAGLLDNGAGTSGVLEVARVLSQAAEEGLYNPSYTVLFVAFASEELGCVGSVSFVRQHKAEMRNIVAVINLDCIGSDNLAVSKTEPSGSLDLDELILKAARDLNIDTNIREQGGSDEQVFLNPRNGENIYSYWWPGLAAGIGDLPPVNSSTLLISYPIYYSDKWTVGKPGWIHTQYDNSSSTQTLNWLRPSILGDHVKVAALSVLRVNPSIIDSIETTETPLIPVLAAGAAITVVVATATIVYFIKVRKKNSKVSNGAFKS